MHPKIRMMERKWLIIFIEYNLSRLSEVHLLTLENKKPENQYHDFQVFFHLSPIATIQQTKYFYNRYAYPDRGVTEYQ